MNLLLSFLYIRLIRTLTMFRIRIMNNIIPHDCKNVSMGADVQNIGLNQFHNPHNNKAEITVTTKNSTTNIIQSKSLSDIIYIILLFIYNLFNTCSIPHSYILNVSFSFGVGGCLYSYPVSVF